MEKYVRYIDTPPHIIHVPSRHNTLLVDPDLEEQKRKNAIDAKKCQLMTCCIFCWLILIAVIILSIFYHH